MTLTSRSRALLRLSPIGALLATVAFVITAILGANRADADPALLANLQHAAEHGTHRDGPMLHVMSAPTPAGRDVTAPSSTATLYDRANLPRDTFADPVSAADKPRLAEVGYTPAGTSHLSALTRHVDPACVGTGTDGNRVQVIYARETGMTDRFSAVEALLRNEIAGVDDVFAVSAAETGGGRRVRWVTDTNCVPVIDQVVLPAGALNDFTMTKNALKAAGYTNGARKYLVFADANRLCGIGDMYLHEAKTGNHNDSGYVMYSRVDTACWATGKNQVSTAAHEVMHTLGAIQNNAPNTTRAGHCTDNGDLMCYTDTSGAPMRQVCPASHEPLFDCNHDDYFSTNPPAGSYLATNWNTADSTFLTSAVPLPEPAPIAIDGPSSGYAGVPFTLTTAATGATGFEWFAPGANTATATGSSATFTFPAAGTVTYTVRALFDGVASTATKAITFTRAAAPAVTVEGPDMVEANQAFTLTATPTAGLAPFTYDWSHLRSTACTIDGPDNAATVAASCAATYPGRAVYPRVRVTAADGQLTTAEAEVQVTVPTMTVSVDVTPTALTVGESGTATVRVGNVPAGWTAIWDNDRGWLQDYDGASVRFTARTVGANQIRVTVKDSTGAQMQTVSADLTAVAAPAATITGPTSVTINRDGTYTASLLDATAASISWTSAKGWLTGPTTGPSTTLTPTATGADTLTATIRTTDGRTATVTRTVTATKEAATFTATATGANPVTLTGTLVNQTTGTAIAKAPVTLQVKWYDTTTWASVATLTTGPDGRVTHPVSAARGGSYQFVYAGTGNVNAAASSAALVKSPSKMTLSVKSGYPTYLTGTLVNTLTGKPFTSGQPVTVKVKWYGTTTWATVTTGLRTDASGRVVYKTNLTRAGYFHMSHASTGAHASSATSPLVQAATKMTIMALVGRPNAINGCLTLGNNARVTATYVTLQYRYAGSSTWRTVAKYKTSSNGCVSARVQPKRATYYRWVYDGASAVLLGTTSAQAYVRY